MSRKDNLQKLIAEHQRHLQILKEQAAGFGPFVPTHIVIQIQDREAEIDDLYAELGASEDSAGPLPTISGRGRGKSQRALNETFKDKSRIKLTEKSANSNPLTFETEERHITIGRAPKNSLKLSDKTVSWEHGQIDLRQGGYFYRHLSKSNFSIVRRPGEEYLLRTGSLQEEIQLRSQDRLIVGDTTFVVEFDLINEDVGYTTTAKPQDDS